MHIIGFRLSSHHSSKLKIRYGAVFDKKLFQLPYARDVKRQKSFDEHYKKLKTSKTLSGEL